MVQPLLPPPPIPGTTFLTYALHRPLIRYLIPYEYSDRQKVGLHGRFDFVTDFFFFK
jgi:hypothetical protein